MILFILKLNSKVMNISDISILKLNILMFNTILIIYRVYLEFTMIEKPNVVNLFVFNS
jgi:hypothetical protein